MNHGSSDAATGLAVAFVLAYLVVLAAIIAFSIWLHWRILAKAGYNGALSLLALTGIGAIVPILILAFGKWPLEAEAERLRSGASGAPPASQLMTP